jgi:drug/metabolite transporter (DMT)-like permease
VLRGRFLTPLGWLGVLLVAGGCILVPLQSFKDFSLQRYFNRTSLWMVLAALGTVGY